MNEQLAALVRRHDPDRFLTALFAPPDKRDDLLALYAFNHELARAREVVSEPPLALIRLQWWREVVEGARRRHETAAPLGDALDRGALLAGRPAAGDRGARDGSGTGDRHAGRMAALHADRPRRPGRQRRPPAGCSRSRAVPAAGGGVSALPAWCAACRNWRRISAACCRPICWPNRACRRKKRSPRRMRRRFAPCSSGWWRKGAGCWASGPRRVRRSAVAAALPAVLARRDLARWPRPAAPRGLGDRLAVIAAGLTRWVR